MKKILFTFAMLIMFTINYAQENSGKMLQSGTIHYKEVVPLKIDLGGQTGKFAAKLPKETISHKALFFNEKAIFYKKSETLEKEIEVNGATFVLQTYESDADNRTFTDLKGKKQIEQREFMMRLFLIEKELDVAKWKLTGNQKTILGYPCQEAVLQEGEEKFIAWFTPAIPISGGPDRFYGLPGMILAVEWDKGKHTITATSIDLTPVAEDLFKIPAKGKKVTQEKFDQIAAKKKEEMKGQPQKFKSIKVNSSNLGEGFQIINEK